MSLQSAVRVAFIFIVGRAAAPIMCYFLTSLRSGELKSAVAKQMCPFHHKEKGGNYWFSLSWCKIRFYWYTFIVTDNYVIFLRNWRLIIISDLYHSVLILNCIRQEFWFLSFQDRCGFKFFLDYVNKYAQYFLFNI